MMRWLYWPLFREPESGAHAFALTGWLILMPVGALSVFLVAWAFRDKG